jgi:hypothetical protein
LILAAVLVAADVLARDLVEGFRAARPRAVRSLVVQQLRFCTSIPVGFSRRRDPGLVIWRIIGRAPVDRERSCDRVAAKGLVRTGRRRDLALMAAEFNVPRLVPARMAVASNDRLDPVRVAAVLSGQLGRVKTAAAFGRIVRDDPAAMIARDARAATTAQADRGKTAIVFPIVRIDPAKVARVSAGIAMTGRTGRTIIGPIGSPIAISGTTGVRTTGHRSTITGIAIGVTMMIGTTAIGGTAIT